MPPSALCDRDGSPTLTSLSFAGRSGTDGPSLPNLGLSFSDYTIQPISAKRSAQYRASL